MDSTHTLSRVEAAVHMVGEEDNRRPCDQRGCHCRAVAKRLPAFGSALIVPPPPDYSTPRAITARCREAGYDHGSDLRTAGNDRAFAKAYKALRAEVPAMPCRVEDLHVSKVRAVWVSEQQIRTGGGWRSVSSVEAERWGNGAGRWELIPAEPIPAPVTIPTPRKRGRKVA